MNTLNSRTLCEKQNTSSSHHKAHIRIVPNIDNPSRSLIFNIIEKDLMAGKVIKIGRFTDKSQQENHISFKSKVVSRSHCEISLSADGKVQLKDTKSSSGTFVNHLRLSPANQESQLTEIKDGDLIQLGVDYQGGHEEIYRSVKMKLEINRVISEGQQAYSAQAFQQLRAMAQKPQEELEECCICLYAMAPLQALFVAPCSHTYHFKCIRPLFDSYPGFQCPVCRTYSDLDASVTVETEDKLSNIIPNQHHHHHHHHNSTSDLDHSCSFDMSPASQATSSLPLSTTLVPPHLLSDHLDSHFESNSTAHPPTMLPPRQKTKQNMVEKIRMAFSNEKRRSAFGKRHMSTTNGGTSSSNSSSSSDEMERSDTYFPISPRLSHSLSRQSTTHHSHLNGIIEGAFSHSAH
ncbi:hypothetical protein BY458DRAFT_508044 [Sporodiniella umbellata]|nr:hypothetical protein BY458DRAFT_508044 [Sporodiniella umbellata]